MSAAKQFFKKALEKTRASAAGALAATSSIDGGVDGSLSSTIPSTSALKIGSEPVTRVANVCNMYQAALKTLAQLKLEILQVLLTKLRLFSVAKDSFNEGVRGVARFFGEGGPKNFSSGT